ncbi:MAG: hypothetical protein L0Z62_30635 [Gemmataceae bacterium]|nr:hypothetical protein [Gemmataceae bacterium]
MPWPEPVGQLLTLTDSRAAQALRWGLRGLRASLQAALEEAPDDPGGAELRNLLRELDSLVDRTGVSSSPMLPSDGTSDRLASGNAMSASGSPRLLPLARDMAADARLQAELSRSPIRDGSDDEIWNDVHRLLLRVPPDLAEEWRRRCQKQAEQAGGRVDETTVAVVPLGRDELLYPGLTGDIRATGLRTEVALDPRVSPSPDRDLHALASVASACLWFLSQDSHLCHCLRNVFRFGVTPLTGEQRERYEAELRRLWERLRAGTVRPQAAAGRQGWKDWLKMCLDFDEAVHSLVYQPPAAPVSWWGRLQGQAREVLFRMRDRAVQAGCPVHLQTLGGNFADISRLAPDSLQVDFGVPGEVAMCLRVWARLDGEEFKGRVLYRSPQEET